MSTLSHSRAAWNRRAFDLGSDEMLAQLLDRGSMADWREIYRLARTDPALRRRIAHAVKCVPLPLPHFWLAALASLGESVDWNVVPPAYDDGV